MIIILDDKQKAGLIVISLVIIILSGTLIIYLENPIWIGFFLGCIIGFGLLALWLYILFLFEFVQVKVQSKTYDKLKEEFKRLKK